jgi:RNA polymerase subunit RPABC4/transcription elongation factor Spt4
MNGFQLADTLMSLDSTGIALLLYGVFILALAGLVVGALLMMGKNVPAATDWMIFFACIGCGVGVYVGALNDTHVKLQSGAYVIIMGWIVALIAQSISSAVNDNTTQRNVRSVDKKCRQCGTIFSGSYSACPSCGSSLYEEIRQTTKDGSNVEKKRCEKCNAFVPSDVFSCPKCGGDSFV